MEQIVPVAARRVAQIDDRYLIAIAVPGDSPVIPDNISLGIGTEEAHPGRTGIFNAGVQPISGLADAGRADHQHVDIPGVNHGSGTRLAVGAAHHNSLLRRQVLSLPPLLWRKRDMLIHGADFRLGRPAGGTMLAVAHGFVLDVVQVIDVRHHGKPAQDSEHPQDDQDEDLDLRHSFPS